jgi:adenine-specific DNA-methyltransferase
MFSPPTSAPLFLDDAVARSSTELQQLGAPMLNAVREMNTSQRLAFARAFCERAIRRYWYASVQGSDDLGGILGCPVGAGDLDEAAALWAERAGEAASQLPAPLAAYTLSTLYAFLMPDQRRSADGVFYTPPALVEELLVVLDHAGVRWHSCRMLDPAAGGGAFIVAAAGRMVSALRANGASSEDVIAHIGDHLSGVELDPFSAWMCRVFLDAVLWVDCRASGTRVGEVVHVRNAIGLPEGWCGGFDLVIGNPPYGRVTLDPGTRSRFARSLFGHANLYGIFTDLGVRLCRPDGIVAYVMPASFLGGEYFKALRTTLMAEAPLISVGFVTDRGGVFHEVLQETVLAVFRRGAEPRPVAVRSVQPLSLDAPCRVVPIATVPLGALATGAPWKLPRTLADARLLRWAGSLPFRIADYGLTVSTGPLVWNRHKAQLSDERAKGCFPLVWAESVLPKGEFAFRAERRNHKPYFRVLPGQNHLLLNEPAVLVQRTTAKEQQRRIQAALLPASFVAENGAVVVENHVNIVRPKHGRSRVPLEAVVALLNSDVVDSIFRCTSGSVAVSAYELESLPVPPPESMNHLHLLLKSGASTTAVESFLRQAYGEAAEAAA